MPSAVVADPRLGRVQHLRHVIQSQQLSKHTLKAYRNDLAKLVEVLGMEAEHDALNAFSLQNFVGCFVAWACGEGIYLDNFAQAVRGPRRPARIPEVPSIEAMQQMLDGGVPSSWPERDHLILELLYGCGLRNSELVGLDLDDRVEQDELIVRGKGKKERKVPIGELARAALKNYLPTRGRVLSNRRKATSALVVNLRGERITTRSVGRLVKQIAQAKGLATSDHPHALRHASVTCSKKGSPDRRPEAARARETCDHLAVQRGNELEPDEGNL